MRQQISISTFRRDLFDTLRRLSIDGPIEIVNHGQTVARLEPIKSGRKPKFDRRRIAHICRKHHVRQLALFGSVLRDDFRADSDIDVLYELARGRCETLHNYTRLRDALVAVFHRPVDLVRRKVIENSPNGLKRDEIFRNAKVIYGA